VELDDSSNEIGNNVIDKQEQDEHYNTNNEIENEDNISIKKESQNQ